MMSVRFTSFSVSYRVYQLRFRTRYRKFIERVAFSGIDWPNEVNPAERCRSHASIVRRIIGLALLCLLGFISFRKWRTVECPTPSYIEHLTVSKLLFSPHQWWLSMYLVVIERNRTWQISVKSMDSFAWDEASRLIEGGCHDLCLLKKERNELAVCYWSGVLTSSEWNAPSSAPLRSTINRRLVSDVHAASLWATNCYTFAFGVISSLLVYESSIDDNISRALSRTWKQIPYSISPERWLRNNGSFRRTRVMSRREVAGGCWR